jgi:hypothetical protein
MKHILIIAAFAFVMTSCSNDDYLIDGGISNGNVGKTTLEFLKSHYQLDTFAILIEKAGMAAQVNGATTLFAPNNLSVRNYINAVLTWKRKTDPLATYTINDIPVDTLTKYMGGYIFDGKIKREDMSQEGTIYTGINGMERRISLEPNTTTYASFTADPVYFVYYTYKKGLTWDLWNVVVDDIKISVRTSNLISTNGVIHILQGSHVLFNYIAPPK